LAGGLLFDDKVVVELVMIDKKNDRSILQHFQHPKTFALAWGADL
jgi:hypothetical protein